MNAIIEKIRESRPQYCHVLVVEHTYDIENAIESIAEEGWSKKVLKEFFNTIDLHCIIERNEDEVYNFNSDEFIDNL